MTKLRTRQYQIELEKLPAAFHGCRLLFLTDMHGEENRLLSERIEEEKPDYILAGGDMLVGESELRRQNRTGMEQAEALLTRLAKKYPVFYTYGNHEKKLPAEVLQGYRTRLEQQGVCFLNNASAALERDGSRIWLHGLDLEWEWYPKGRRRKLPVSEMKKKLPECPEEHPDGLCHILLAHHPNYFSAYAAWGADLILSGHIHGGVMRLPWIGGVIGPDFLPFPPYSGGLYQNEKAQMIVSCGLGSHTIKLRLFNPPELTSIELRGRSAGK